MKFKVDYVVMSQTPQVRSDVGSKAKQIAPKEYFVFNQKFREREKLEVIDI